MPNKKFRLPRCVPMIVCLMLALLLCYWPFSDCCPLSTICINCLLSEPLARRCSHSRANYTRSNIKIFPSLKLLSLAHSERPQNFADYDCARERSFATQNLSHYRPSHTRNENISREISGKG